jgi:hypothetical protein
VSTALHHKLHVTPTESVAFYKKIKFVSDNKVYSIHTCATVVICTMVFVHYLALSLISSMCFDATFCHGQCLHLLT